MADEIPPLDLLGEPLRDLPDGRGRPKHRVTPESRSKVSMLRAAGMSRAEIADVLSVSKPTLEKYYFSELNEGVTRERATAIGWLRESARAGNISAQKAYLSLLDAGRGVAPVSEAPEEQLGKKAAAKLAAQAAPVESGWGDLVKH